MRPAMRFRGEIETGRIPGVLLVPRDAVFLRDDGPVVWARRALGWREVRVTLGRSNRTQVEIVSGLAAGDRVSPVDLAEPRGGGAGRARRSRRMRRGLAPRARGPSGVAVAGGRPPAPGPPRGRSRPLARGGRRSPPSRSRPGPLRARGGGARQPEGGQGDARPRAPGVRPRAEGGVPGQGRRDPEEGRHGGRVRPLRRAEGGGGRAGRPHRRAGEDRQGEGGGLEEREVARPRPRRRDGGARPRGDLQADRRGPVLAAPDHRVAARPRPLRRPRRRGGPQARREREALLGRAGARRDRRGQGEAQGGASRRRACGRCASPPPTTASWSSSATGAARSRSWATPSGRGRRSPSCPTSRCSRPRCSCSRPTARA